MLLWLSSATWAADFSPHPPVFPLPPPIAAPGLARGRPAPAAVSSGALVGVAGMTAVLSVGSFLAASRWETAFLAEGNRTDAEPLHTKTNVASGVGIAAAVASGALVTVAIVGGGK